MAILSVEQVKAPDFSASSEMMARANQSFTSGIDSAKGILDKYNSGQQAKSDNALTQLLAGASSEEELSKLMATTDISKMNISDKMRENYLGARGVILGNNSTRQNTSNAADSNSRANAGEGRVAAEYADGVAARDELRGMTPAYVTALQEGQRNGYGASSNEREMLAATLQAEAGGEGVAGMVATGAVIRNRAETGKYGGNSISGVIMKPGQFSAWNGVTGYADGQGSIDMNKLNVSKDAYAAADAILSGNYEDPTGGATHYYNPNVATPAWGKNQNPAGGGGDWTTIGNHVFGNPDGVRASASGPSPAYVPGAITSNPPVQGGMTDFADALRAGTRMAPDEAAKLYNSVINQQAQGQGLIDAAEAKRQTEAVAAATRDAILNPNNLTQDAVTRDLMSIDGVSSVNAMTASGQDRSKFGGVITPAIAPDTEVSAALARTRASDTTAAENDPIARSFAMAESFNTSGDVGKTLMSEFDIPKDSGLNSDDVDRTIQRLAKNAGVTPGQMATVMSQSAQGNYEQFSAMVLATPDSKMESSVIGIAKNTFGTEAKAAYETKRADSSRREADRASADLQLSTARTRAAKLTIGSDARASADAEVANLKDTIIKGMTPKEREQNLVDYVSKTGMGSRLQGLNPQSAEFFRAMAQLEETIKADSSLTQNEKELLLKDVRG